MPIFFAFFDFAERAGRAIWANPVARWIVLIITGLFIHRLWLWRRDSRKEKEIKQDIEIKAQETAREVITKAEEKTHDVIAKADEARASIPRGTPSGELPDRTQSILFDD